jgi:hypothetical protein
MLMYRCKICEVRISNGYIKKGIDICYKCQLEQEEE